MNQIYKKCKDFFYFIFLHNGEIGECDDLFLSLKVEEKTRLTPKYKDQLFLDSLAIFKTKMAKKFDLNTRVCIKNIFGPYAWVGGGVFGL